MLFRSKNSYILIENSFIQPLWNLKQIIYELILKGFTPILAHPERYSYYFDNKNEYLDLHQKGCLFQINILSLTDVYGKEVRKTALWLIEKGLMDFISTDLHNKKQAELIELYLRSSAYKKILPHLTSKVKNDFI